MRQSQQVIWVSSYEFPYISIYLINLGLKSLSTISLWRPKSSMDRLSFLELLNLMDASIFSQKKESRLRTISWYWFVWIQFFVPSWVMYTWGLIFNIFHTLLGSVYLRVYTWGSNLLHTLYVNAAKSSTVLVLDNSNVNIYIYILMKSRPHLA